MAPATESLLIPASKKKAALLLLGSIAFVAVGWLIRQQHPVAAWLAIVFFALGIPVALYMMFTKKIYLLLDAAGFEMGSPIKTVRVAWNEVDGFGLAAISGARMIAVQYNARYREQRLLRGIAAGLTGIEGGIPNNYALPLEDVLELLWQWHARYGGVDSVAAH